MASLKGFDCQVRERALELAIDYVTRRGVMEKSIVEQAKEFERYLLGGGDDVASR